MKGLIWNGVEMVEIPIGSSYEKIVPTYKQGRLDGPTVVHDGIELWYYNGVPHRVGGPAGFIKGGNSFYMQHGNYHREDGPAIIHGGPLKGPDDVPEYYLFGTKLTHEEFLENTPLGKSDEERLMIYLKYKTVPGL
jgi:hypothetical protein